MLRGMAGLERKTLFAPMFESFTETKRGRTREIYECTLRKLRAYRADFDSMGVEEISYEWLCGFEAFLAETAPSRNGRNIHLRNVRTVYYLALDDGLTLRNPFRRFRIRAEETAKRALTEAQLRRLATARVEPWQEKYRDAFLLMFMLRGINAVDFCHLEAPDGRMLRYRRRKTGQLIEVRIEAPAMELIERLRGERHYLYPLDRVKDYRRYTARLNKGLQRIAADLGLPPGLTSYWARHTWATLAAKHDIPKETIARGLGHTPRTTTDIYIDFDLRKVHAANRRLLRLLFPD